MWTDGQRERGTDVTKLIVAFRHFAIARHPSFRRTSSPSELAVFDPSR